MLLQGLVPRNSFDYKHHQTFYSNVDSKMEVREYVSRFPFFLAALKSHIRGYQPRLVVPNSKHGRSVTYVYVDCDNFKTMVQHNLFMAGRMSCLWKRLPDQ